MKYKTIFQTSTLIFFLLFSQFVFAKVVSADKSHFTLQLVAESSKSPKQVWDQLLIPAKWWQSSHTYSGDAANLSLEAKAGGLWREDWEGGSVLHGTVLNLQANKLLRLSAPFGPLQALAVETVWTITLTPNASGTLITFDFVANGTQASELDQLAPAVDYVKAEALKSLAN